MSNLLENLRAFAAGRLDESALQESMNPDLGTDFENDEEFMQECMGACIGTILLGEILGENADTLDEDVQKAVVTLQDYLVGQGMMSEAATVSVSNPKINVVRLNKQAQINRLTTIITLKMARKDNVKAYQKYKLGQKIKKTNMEDMRKRYGAKAERLAKKLWAKTKKSGKVAAVVDSTQTKKAEKK